MAFARSGGGLSARLLLILMGLLTAALVGLVAWSVVLGLRVHEKHQLEAQRQEALHAARQETVNLLSLNYKTLERDIDRVLDGTTGKFRDRFASQTGTLKQFMGKVKPVSTAKVRASGIVSMDEDSAEVLIVADQTVGGPQAKEDVVRHHRLSVDLALRDGRWLVSNVGYVG